MPDIPESFLTESFEKSNHCREQLIYNQRISTLLPIFLSKDIQLNVFDKNKKQNELFNNILYKPPIDALSTITPQQVQFISNLANFIYTNPEVIVFAIQNILVQSSIALA